MHTFLQILAIVLVALDAATTCYALRKGGFVEGNYILRHMIEELGLGPAVVISHGLVAAVLWKVPLPDWSLIAICAVYGYWVVSNVRLLWKNR